MNVLYFQNPHTEESFLSHLQAPSHMDPWGSRSVVLDLCVSAAVGVPALLLLLQVQHVCLLFSLSFFTPSSRCWFSLLSSYLSPRGEQL